ncbi:MAG: hypothetical protein KAR79_03730, partial [Simkaniaceae bacterium]|nr:hypothetical protein [Simkaniaceae bacterium]
MSVVFESPRVSLNYLPEDAFYVFDAMQKASSLASGSFFEAYVLAPISRANAVLGSLVNIPIYCIQGIYSDPNVAFNAAMQSTIFVALGFFYIVGLDFFLDQSAGVAPIISDPRVPEPMSSQSDGPSESPYQRSLGALRETAETIESTIREVRDREWFDRLRESFQTIIAAHRALTSNEEMDHTVIFYFSHGEESERQISFLINSERQFIEALEILEWNFDLLSRRVHENASSSISHSNSGEIEPLSDRFERTWIRTYNDWNGRAHSVRSRKYRVPMQIYLEELRSVLDTSLFNEFNPANPFHALIQTLNYNLNHPTLDARSDYLTFVNTLRLIIIHDDYRAILENSSRSSVERRILDLVEHCNNTRWASTELYEFSSNYLSLILDAAVAAEHPGLTHSFPELSLANFSNELQKLNNLVKEAPQSVKKGHLGVIAQRLRGEIGTEDFTGVMNIPFLREKQVFIKNGQEQEISCLRHGCPTTGGSYWRAFGRMITNAVNRVNPTFYNLPDVDSGEEVASDFLDFIRSQTEREGFFITVHQSRIAQSITGTEHQRVGKIVELQETFEHLHVLVQGMDGDFFKRQTSRFTEITTFHELARELVNQFTQSDSDYGPGKICDLPNRLKNDPSYRAELEHIFSTVHQILFEGRECIEAGDAEWQSFINFCYSMQRMDLKFRLSSEEHPIST